VQQAVEKPEYRSQDQQHEVIKLRHAVQIEQIGSAHGER
jgi:hypothetical protein